MPALALDALVDQLEADRDLGGQLVHRAYLPGQPARLAPDDPRLHSRLRLALATFGISHLYRHQAEGLAAVERGEHVLLSTPTASGKSLVFQLPVIEETLRGGSGRALFLFPLKALEQDQHARLVALLRAAGCADEKTFCRIYDGDTPRAERKEIRDHPPRVLVSNPDMVHFALLANPAAWQGFLRDLRWIVIDELHTYRGVFGSHFHHVLQRLLRLARRSGAAPVLIASSATAENASAFAAELAGESFTSIVDSGAARLGRHVLLFQPATSPYTTTLALFARLLDSGLKTIVFTKARRITELLHSWLAKQRPDLAPRIANYRAGFLADERRAIERDLFTGKTAGVISTSALELGIDIGGLDACILVGYPGSMMATWQRSGRVGRLGRESITALVALPDALDQYLLQNPDEFLNRPCEPLIVRPGVPAIAAPHLLCAAAEQPLEEQADHTYLERHRSTVDQLVRDFELQAVLPTGHLHCAAAAPHRRLHLRGTGSTFTIESTVSGRPIGTVDGVRVLRECHPGAVYLHAGRQYWVSELDLQRRRVRAEPAQLDYFTTPLSEKETTILAVEDERRAGSLHAWRGLVRVVERTVGFERKRLVGQERLGQEPLELPYVEYETSAFWFAAPLALEQAVRISGCDFMGSLHAAEHAAISLFPVLALCDRGDLGGISISYHPQVQSGAVFVYDAHGGALGVAENGFAELLALLERVERLLERCPCAGGCPSCVQSPKCGNGNRPLDKDGALLLVRLLLDRAGAEAQPASAAHGGLWLEAPMPSAVAANHGSLVQPAAPVNRYHGADSARDAASPERSGDLFDLEHPSGERPNAAPAPPVRRRAALPRTSARTVLFDVETKRSAGEVGGFAHLQRLGVALAVTLDLEEGRFSVYHERDVAALVAQLRGAHLVVGFNAVGFDYPVLQGYVGEDLRRTLPTLDLFEEVERTTGLRVGLSHLATETLGASKSADGLASLEWVKEGRFDLIEQYCRHDVALLRDLYLYGRREGCLLFRNKEDQVVRIPVDWPVAWDNSR